MHLVGTEELFGEISEPDKAEFQTITSEPDPAHCKEHGIDCREDRKNEDQGHGRRDKELAGMAVNPLAPALALRAPSQGNPWLGVC